MNAVQEPDIENAVPSATIKTDDGKKSWGSWSGKKPEVKNDAETKDLSGADTVAPPTVPKAAVDEPKKKWGSWSKPSTGSTQEPSKPVIKVEEVPVADPVLSSKSNKILGNVEVLDQNNTSQKVARVQDDSTNVKPHAWSAWPEKKRDEATVPTSTMGKKEVEYANTIPVKSSTTAPASAWSLGSAQGTQTKPKVEQAGKYNRPVKEKKDIRTDKDTVIGKEKKSCNRCCWWLLGLIILLLGIGAGIGIGLYFFKDDDGDAEPDTKPAATPSPAPVSLAPSMSPTVDPNTAATEAPTGDLQRATYDLICERLPSSCKDLMRAGTPQNAAMVWLNKNERLALYTDEVKLSRYALAAFYYSTNGDGWTQNQNWLTDADACLWFYTGSACGPTKEIISLEMDSNKVSGSIPRDLALLTSLETISIRNGEDSTMIGTLPSELSALTGLTSFAISNNKLTGGIPTSYGVWINLQSLELRNNGLQGSLDGTSFASTYSKLTSMDLGGNQFTGSLPASLLGASSASTAALTSLRLDNNQFIGDVPSQISNLSSLQILSLARNKLTNFPYSATLLPNLQELDISYNGFGGYLISQIGDLVNLRTLQLQGNAMTGPLPSTLGRLTNLQTLLDLSNNGLSGPIPSTLGGLTGLKRLFLNANLLTGTVPASFSNMTAIQTIRIDANSLTGLIPAEVCSLYSQTEPLSYADCQEVQGDCITYCCVDGGQCTCRYANTVESTRCFSPPS
jgi:Leucine rich repeat